MMMYRFLTGIFIVLSCCCACKNKPGEKQTESSLVKNTLENTQQNKPQKFIFTVVPGKRLGNMVIGKNATAVLDSLGKADKGDAAMGKAESTYKLNVAGKKSVLTIFTARKMGVEDFSRIQLIRTTSKKYHLKNGLGVGSSRKEIEKRFTLNLLGTFSEKGNPYALYDTSQGIAFEIGPKQKCHGILLHDSSKNALEVYLGVYQDFKKK